MQIREQVTWALGNIAGDCVGNRDAIVNSGCIPTLLNGLQDVVSSISLLCIGEC